MITGRDCSPRQPLCRFATSDLADRMLSRGLDLASVIEVDPLHSWTEIAIYHSSPEGLFERFWRHGVTRGRLVTVSRAA